MHKVNQSRSQSRNLNQNENDEREFMTSEFDDDISLDSDDTDFNNFLIRQNCSTMSIAGVHSLGFHTRHISLLSLNDNIDNWNYLPISSVNNDNLDWSCCFTCGVSWPDQHVSLDCKECGGYSMNRPCVLCDGQCGAIWKRDLPMSHASSWARWRGECNQKSILSNDNTFLTVNHTTTVKIDQNSNIQQDLCPKFENLATAS